MGIDARAEDDALVLVARAGDRDALDLLIHRWLPEALDLARFVLASRDDALAAVAEAIEEMWHHLPSVEPGSFGALLLRTTRRAALERLVAGALPAEQLECSSTLITVSGASAEDRLASSRKAVDAMADPDLASVARSAAVVIDPAERSLLLLHLRDQIPAAELARDAHLGADETEQLLFRVRARYRAALEARLLWRCGHPHCRDLAALISSAGDGRFDADTAARIVDHAEACTTCKGAKRTRIPPVTLLSALPAKEVDEPTAQALRQRLALQGFTLGVVPPAGAPRAPGRGDGDARQRQRRSGVFTVAGVAALLMLLLVLALRPWASGAKREVGVLGGASDGSTAHGSIQPTTTGRAGSTRPTASSTHVSRTTPTTTGASVSLIPPPTSTAPSPTNVKHPVVTSASATYEGTCADGSSIWLRVTWATRDATTVALVPQPSPPGPFPGAGSADVCVRSLPATITLTAAGPGGQTTQLLEVSGPVPTTSSTTSTTTSTTVITTSSTTSPG